MADIKLGDRVLSGVKSVRLSDGASNGEFVSFGLGSLPEGGAANQILQKQSGADYDCAWVDGAGAPQELVQETGTSEDKVMSQKAVTDELTKLWDTINYVAPTIAEFSTTPTATLYKLPAEFNLTKITHRETKITNIQGKLTLKRGGTVLLTDIAPTETSTAVNITDAQTLTTSPITYVLSGVNIKGEVLSRSVSVAGYYASYIGASIRDAVSEELFTELAEVNSSSLAGTRDVDFENPPKYVWFISTKAISDVSSGGFNVPITLVDGAFIYNGGSYKCYRTEFQTTSAENTFVIK